MQTYNTDISVLEQARYIYNKIKICEYALNTAQYPYNSQERIMCIYRQLDTLIAQYYKLMQRNAELNNIKMILIHNNISFEIINNKIHII